MQHCLFASMSVTSKETEIQMNFFPMRNQAYPPALSDYGNLHSTSKSELLKELENKVSESPADNFESAVIDGGTLIHHLSPGCTKTLADYCVNVFSLTRVTEISENGCCVGHISRRKYSIMNCTREKRGVGIRLKVSAQAMTPAKKNDFLWDSNNKDELFDFLSTEVDKAEWPPNKMICITKGSYVILKGSSCQMECTQVEADRRVVVHVQHSLECGYRKIVVQTVDTDVVVILISHFFDLKFQYPQLDLWVAFGTGKYFRYKRVNSICLSLGKSETEAMPAFHAYSGCDTTSSFPRWGKKSTLVAWKSYSATQAFLHMRNNPFSTIDSSLAHVKTLERLTLIMYDKASQLQSAKEAWRELFSKKSRTLEKHSTNKGKSIYCLNQKGLMYQEEYRQHVETLNPQYHHLKIGDGKKMKRRGNLFGWQSLKLQKLGKNW